MGGRRAVRLLRHWERVAAFVVVFSLVVVVGTDIAATASPARSPGPSVTVRVNPTRMPQTGGRATVDASVKDAITCRVKLTSGLGVTVMYSHNWRNCSDGSFKSRIVIVAEPADLVRTLRFAFTAARGTQETVRYFSVAVESAVMPTTTTTGSAASATTTAPPYGFGPDGAISGVVTDTSLNPLGGVQVGVYVPGAAPVEAGFTTTSTDGTYEVTSLRPGVYWVCFGTEAVVGASTTGYQVQCYHNVLWAGFGHAVMPYGVVTVSEGSTTSAVDVTLQAGAAISGTVSDASGRPVANLVIQVTSTTGDWWEQRAALTAADGTYSVLGLAPGNYYVCFQGSQVSEPGAPTGYLGQCYNTVKNVPWELNKAVNGETAVTETVGVTVANINAQLDPGGGISGRVTNSASAPLQGVSVSVYYDGARPAFAGGAVTEPNGTFTVPGLPAGSYLVCFTTGSFSPSADGYTGQCYGEPGPWKGYPNPPTKGAKAVITTPGIFTGNVNEKLN